MIFLEVEITDPSDFAAELTVRGEERVGDWIVQDGTGTPLGARDWRIGSGRAHNANTLTQTSW